jgi:hypothetical protein
MPLRVLVLKPRQPRRDLRAPEAQVPTHAELGRTTCLRRS